MAGERPPADAANALPRLVSRLRKALPDGLAEGQTDGCRLTVSPAPSTRCGSNASPPKPAMTNGSGSTGCAQPSPCGGGAALQGVGLTDSPAFAAAVTRLEGLRLVALEDRFTAEVSLGHDAGLIAELTDRCPRRRRVR